MYELCIDGIIEGLYSTELEAWEQADRHSEHGYYNFTVDYKHLLD